MTGAAQGAPEYHVQVIVRQERTAAASDPAAADATPPRGAVACHPVFRLQKLISHPTPVYPPIAKSARVQGTVTFQAAIGPDGTVQNLQVLSAASPLLVQSAMDAVKEWVYSPTLLNGNPVTVVTTIDVNFTLAN